MLCIDRLGYWAKQYGFGAPTGIDLPNEVGGIVPTNQWKIDTLGEPIYPGEVYQAGIGQGYDVVTPIQLINAYAALANGGKLYQPQIVRVVIGPDGTVVGPFEPKLIRELDAPERTLRENLRLAHQARLHPPILTPEYADSSGRGRGRQSERQPRSWVCL
jgi:penicillin-binding protein 2